MFTLNSCRVLLAGLVFTAATLSSLPHAQALEAGDFMIRLRGVGVIPTGNSDNFSPNLTTAGVEAQPMGVPELDFTYMITDEIGLELIATTTPHDIDGTGSISGLGDVGDVWLLPPTLLAQYHFLPGQTIRPYIGAGINYTVAYGEDVDSSLENVIGPADLNIDNSVGWAVQAGVDWEFDERWSLNFDVKYISLSPTATLTTATTRDTAEVHINPVIVGVGIGYRF